MIAQIGLRERGGPVWWKTWYLLSSFDTGEPCGLFVFGKKTGANGVGRELAQFFAGKSLLGVREQELVGEIGAEEGGIVGVERHQQAEIEVAAQRMVGKGGAYAGADVGGGVQLERGAPRSLTLGGDSSPESPRVRGRCARSRWRALRGWPRGRWFRRHGWSAAGRPRAASA